MRGLTDGRTLEAEDVASEPYIVPDATIEAAHLVSVGVRC
jgi:hypothetical protein